MITRVLGEDAARNVLDYVSPAGESQDSVERALRAVRSAEAALP
ncbi:hypothetical protein AB0A81_40745 [Streptomyces flaveolus]|uniref:Uncharacterized protein n=1 Tax=Streptomyces flaveolus TaxID=67297 RepID=A0ABV1VTB9_9ACTN